MTYEQWFNAVTRHGSPHAWQAALAADSDITDRLIRIPTGMGKTEGVLASWAWHRLVQGNDRWPRRLVWCLPMRVLVEQTREVARSLLARMRELDGKIPEVGVHALIGGTSLDAWHLHPELPAVLIGTQDMLLSRALNRGYATGRARWPMEYGLLNQDALWVMDEVQLMDVGLATSVQLQAFRRSDQEHGRVVRPSHTWWMSATLQPEWMETPESADWLPALRDASLRVPTSNQRGTLWEVAKPLEVVPIPAEDDRDCKQLARLVWDEHARATPPKGQGRVTLVIVNRVETATAVYQSLARLRGGAAGPDIRLIHSRFRPLERKGWAREFLSRDACEDQNTDRIIVATQVVEAGVDISASVLVTELAPWSSLVQRFGRAARYGGSARVVVVDRNATARSALPYALDELIAAAESLKEIGDVGPAALERYEAALEESDPERLQRLYPYEPLHLLTPRENAELFGTGPDLSGADIDVSRFIREGVERDVFLFWIAEESLPEGELPSPDIRPQAESLCGAPVYLVQSWLFQGNRLKPGHRAWIWDYVRGEWRVPQAPDCYPGQVFLISADTGGYDVQRGFTGAKPGRGDLPIPLEGPDSDAGEEAADSAQGRDDGSQHPWKTIAAHGWEAGQEARRLGESLGLEPQLTTLLELAGRVHDWGKAHRAFACSIIGTPPALRCDFAKAPRAAWAGVRDLYCMDGETGPRRGFRHELASALALFELLRGVDPEHEALLGPHRALIEAGVLGEPEPQSEEAVTGALAAELGALSAHTFNLLTYLVCAHHGKVRESWQATPRDQDFPFDRPGLSGEGQPLLGVRQGDILPPIVLTTASGTTETLPELVLHLDLASMGLSSRYGASWSERVHGLIERHGPFALAYLEALLRVADVRASRLETPDPLLAKEGTK